MSRRPRFNEAQYQYARHEANALDYAMGKGYDLKREGHNYRLREHSSMVFTPDGRWFWNSRSLKGRVIEFLMHYEGKTLSEAVLALCEADGRTFSDAAAPCPQTTPPPVPKRDFALPPKAEGHHRLFAYLCKTRGLDRGIVRALIRKGDLYESVRRYGEGKEAHNAVFVGRDMEGVPRSAFQRGLSSGSAFKRDAAGSDPAWPFVLSGRHDVSTVMVFEGAIDAISHATLLKAANRDYAACDRIALGGTQKGVGLTAYLERHPNIKKVILAMDADEAGRRAAEKMRALIPEERYAVSVMFPPAGKDWNEYLRIQNRPDRTCNQPEEQI